MIFYPLAAIMLIVFAITFDGIVTGSNSVVVTDAGRAPQTDWVAFAFVVFFVFAALLVDFLARERFRLRPRDGVGSVVIEIGAAAGIVRFVPLIAVIPFVVGLGLFLLQPDSVDVDVRSLTLTEPLFLWLPYGIAHFLFVAFLLRAIRNRSFFVWTDKGFLYEPGDISPGLIHWEDVAEIKQAEGLTNGKNDAGPATGTVLAFALKNPEACTRPSTPLLRMLNSALTPTIRRQTGGPGDVALASEDFGARYHQVRDLMMKHSHARGAQGPRSP